MALLNQTFPTLLDAARRTDASGRMAKVAEVLTIASPIIEDAPWFEANGMDGHLITQRNALPSLTWRKFNQGILPTKSGTSQFTESTGMLDGVAKIDKALAERNGSGYRESEEKAFLASYSRYMENAFLYASTKTTPEQISGMAPRLDTTTNNPYASQIIKADGSASGNDQASAWIVGWGEGKVYGIYPKGSKAGLDVQDYGDQLTPDGVTTGAEFPALRTYFSWKAGFAVEDARYLVRIANIDTSNLIGAESSQTLISALTRGIAQIQDLRQCRPVIYMNRNLITYLQLQSFNAMKNANLTFDMVGGRRQDYFMGIPIHMTDALLNTESPVV